MKLRLPKLPRLLVGGYRELRRPRFPIDRELVSRQLREAAKLPENSVKPLLVEENDYHECTTWPVDANWSPV